VDLNEPNWRKEEGDDSHWDTVEAFFDLFRMSFLKGKAQGMSDERRHFLLSLYCEYVLSTRCVGQINVAVLEPFWGRI